MSVMTPVWHEIPWINEQGQWTRKTHRWDPQACPLNACVTVEERAELQRQIMEGMRGIKAEHASG